MIVKVNIEFSGLLRPTMKDRDRIWAAANAAAVEAARREEQTIELENAVPQAPFVSGLSVDNTGGLAQASWPGLGARSVQEAASQQAARERAYRDAHSPPEAEAAETESLAHRIEKLEAALAKHVGVGSALFTQQNLRMDQIDKAVEKLRGKTFCNVVNMTVVEDKIKANIDALVVHTIDPIKANIGALSEAGSMTRAMHEELKKHVDKLEADQTSTARRLLKLGNLLAAADVAVR